MTKYSEIYGDYISDMQNLDNARLHVLRAIKIMYNIDSEYMDSYDIIDELEQVASDIQEIKADITDSVGYDMCKATKDIKVRKDYDG